MGRKALPEGSLRDQKVYLRFTSGEYRRVTTWFKESTCRTIGEFCYKAIRDARIVAYTRIDVPQEMQTELKRIGNNINQIAFALNQRKGDPMAEESFRLLLQISRQLEALVNSKDPAI